MGRLPATRGDDRPPRVGLAMLARFGLAAVIITLATAAAVASAVLLQVKDVVDTIQAYGHVAPVRKDTLAEAKPGKPQTLLLVGSDRRFGSSREDARSDTLMLVRLDPDQEATAVLSIPRDLQVQIPDRGLAKINEAYSLGGLDLVARTIKDLLSRPGEPFRINHVIGVNFSGFREAVDQIGCVYTEVDRRYYHSNAGLPASQQYAEINLQPGYQRLCGQRSLDYVRFRHLDNDLVRAARQQSFLRDAKDQLATRNLLDELHPLVRIFAKATETDAALQRSSSILSLARLAIYSAGHPVRQIQFPATFVNVPAPALGQDGTLEQPEPTGMGSYVTTTPEQLDEVVHAFMHATAAEKRAARAPRRSSKRKTRRDRRSGPTAYGLVDARRVGEDLVAPTLARRRVGLPFLLPRWLTPRGRYATNAPNAPSPRLYRIKDRDGTRHRAYRLVVSENPTLGQHYGIQGTTWKDPPILDGPSGQRRMGGRAFDLYYDGTKLRIVALRTARGVYWVSNTLTGALSNDQMLGIARSLTPFGRR